MPPKKRRVKTNRRKLQVIVILLLIVAAVFFFYEEFGKEKTSLPVPEIKPEAPPPELLPRVALVIDDLGPNKKMSIEVLTLDAPLTLSILPHEVYSSWIAEEGYKLGRDIIVHIPMQATRPLRLGKGGLYTWMTDKQLVETLKKDINSVPHIIGASSHMGSALTKDERVMNVVMKELKKQGLFFLDSLTTPETVGYRLAKTHGLVAFQRDVFLDDSNKPQDIKIQWDRLVRIAQRRGYAIAQGHPRKNTIEFLNDALRENNDIRIVPLSELIE